MPLMTRDEIRAVYRQGEEAVISLVEALLERIAFVEERVKHLEQQIAKNSSNSSKPPSTDGLKKPAPKSLRTPSGKKSGGQPGHEGNTLARVENPDHVVIHPVNTCRCGADLSKTTAQDYESRQVFDLPEPKLDVTEHRCEIKECPDCGETITASFPIDVTAPVQYGASFRSLLVYLKDGQLLPLDRISQLCADLFGYEVNPATIESARQTCYNTLQPFEEALKEALVQSDILHSDESGLRVEGKLHWLHVVSNRLFTFFGVHSKRGSKAPDDFGILPRFTGILVHDFWKAYFSYACAHVLCNAHHLRELVFLFEELHQKWAGRMKELLLKMLECVQAQPPGKTGLTVWEQKLWLEKYQNILEEGYRENPAPPVRTGQRGRLKKTKAQNLLERLDQHRKSVLAFLSDFNIPFTNNQGEQDIRMIKCQQKISGGFRTMQGAKTFARIRSYISTARKHHLNVFHSIIDAMTRQPFMPLCGMT